MKDRHAFTIVELLIVITIIAVLLAMTLRVVGAFLTSARESATRATIGKIQTLIKHRAEAFHRQYSWSNKAGAARLRSIAMDDGNDDRSFAYWRAVTGDEHAALILAEKSAYRTAFPQVFADLPSPTTDPLSYSAWGAGSNPAMSNAELLYWFVTSGPGIGDPANADEFSTSEYRDTDGDGFPEFVDGWGRPIQFYRWPTRLVRDPAARTLVGLSMADTDLLRDPDDALNDCGVFPGFPAAFHDVKTWHGPLIVSAGPDGVPGLFPPDDTANGGRWAAVSDYDALADDLTNFRALRP